MIAGLEALSAYLIVYVPLLGFLALGQPVLFFLYGLTIALTSFFSLLFSTIQKDIAERKRNGKGKRHA